MTTIQSSADVGARITDEGIARMRERIGVVVPREAPFNHYAHPDGFRHFANGYGDDNPMYCDEEYAAGARWGTVIAPPGFLMTMGVSEVKSLRPEVRARGAHALAGVHEFLAGDEWEWFQPVRPGDTMTKRYYLYSVEEKARSSFSGSRSLINRYRLDFVNQDGNLVGIDRCYYVRTERAAAAETKKYSFERHRFTPEELAEIDEAYAGEEPRGAEPRYWEDVQPGDELRPMVKGPLTVTEVMAFMRGWGGGVAHSRLAWKHRSRHPKFYSRNDLNFWDVVERGHWEQEWANRIGNPYPYDFGRMRCCYLSELATNWMGDDGWLWKLATQFRRFDYMGDLTWVKGRVLSKNVENGQHVVELDIWCENHRGEVTAPGHARVLLPSREHGPVHLPEPSAATEGTVPLIY